MKQNLSFPFSLKSFTALCFLFLFAFSIGNGIAALKQHFFPDTVTTAADSNWGLSFQTEGETPVGNATIEELAEYNAYYAKDTDEKIIYLTFDAGYENGNTAPILDALKKHQTPATFFVVGTYVKENPDLIMRMKEEGHIVGNHTYHHKDMSVSCPTAEMIGTLHSNTALATISSLKANKSSMEPPPRPTIITSTLCFSKARIPSTILCAAPSP